MVVSGVWHPAPSLVTREVGDSVDVSPQELLEAVQGATVHGPVVSNGPGEGIKKSGSLDGEAGFLQGLGFELDLIVGSRTILPFSGLLTLLMFPIWGTKPSKIFQHRMIL